MNRYYLVKHFEAVPDNPNRIWRIKVIKRFKDFNDLRFWVETVGYQNYNLEDTHVYNKERTISPNFSYLKHHHDEGWLLLK